MKKIGLFALVLSVAGLATAALSFKVNGHTNDGYFPPLGPVTVEIVNDEAFVGMPEIYWASVPLAVTTNWGSGAVVQSPPGVWAVEQYGPYGDKYWWTITDYVPSVGSTLAGPMFSFSFDMTGLPLQFIVYDRNETVQAAFSLLPEPMTLLLLGLGGLLIRRKNKER
jgi:hypothetical protein